MTTIDQKIVEIIQEALNINDWPLGNLLLSIISILLCVLLTGLVGFEREKRGRSAGLRTHLLVGVGSCVIMIISIYGFPNVFSGHRDVARLAAGVLTGVGFLGAGAIIHDHGSIKGLTTAGTIWLVMAIGLACGSFNFLIAILVTFVVMIVLTLFRKIETRLNKNSPILLVVSETSVPVLAIVLKYAKENKLLVTDVNTELLDERSLQTIFKLVSENNAAIDVTKIEEDIKKLTNAKSVQNLNRH
jgi:putative Mg2+ transporter-C (MgtC) family protein